MNIQEISTFLAICTYGSFNKASEHLHMTQPTVSWYVTTLEKELGVQLFFRKRGQKESVLTDAGKIFYPQALKWEALWNETRSLLEKKPYVKYNFACIHSLSHHLIPFLHAYFETAMPDCSISLVARPSTSIITGIENKEYDAGVSVICPDTDRALITPLATEKMVFTCLKDSNYPDFVHVSDLNIRNCVRINWTDDLDHWMQKNFWGRPYAELNSFDELMYFFSNRDNWAILPYSSYFQLKDSLRICELDFPPKDRPFYLVSAQPPKTEFLDHLENALKSFLAPYSAGIEVYS